MTTKLILAAVGLLALSAIPTKAVARDRCYRPSYGYGYYHSAPVYRTGYVVRDYGYYAPRHSRYYRIDRSRDYRPRYRHHRHHHHRHGIRGVLRSIFR